MKKTKSKESSFDRIARQAREQRAAGSSSSQSPCSAVMWAWWDGVKYCHIYDRKFLVEMCSPDGFKQREARGEGKIVEIVVSPNTEDRRASQAQD